MGQDTEQKSVLENARMELFNMNMSHVTWAVVQVNSYSCRVYNISVHICMYVCMCMFYTIDARDLCSNEN